MCFIRERAFSLYLFFVIIFPYGSMSVEVKVHLDKGIITPGLIKFAKRVENKLTLWYPYISGVLESPNYSPPSRIDIYLLESSLGNHEAAYTFEGSVIVGNLNYYKTHLNDIGSMIHELVHVIQQYPTDSCPQWLSEGIADYIRYYKFGHSRRKPKKSNYKQSHYTDGYDVTAYFLNYIVQNIREDLVYWINMACREGNYNEEMIWFNLAGKHLGDLWTDMLRNG